MRRPNRHARRHLRRARRLCLHLRLARSCRRQGTRRTRQKPPSALAPRPPPRRRPSWLRQPGRQAPPTPPRRATCWGWMASALRPAASRRPSASGRASLCRHVIMHVYAASRHVYIYLQHLGMCTYVSTYICSISAAVTRARLYGYTCTRRGCSHAWSSVCVCLCVFCVCVCVCGMHACMHVCMCAYLPPQTPAHTPVPIPAPPPSAAAASSAFRFATISIGSTGAAVCYV